MKITHKSIFIITLIKLYIQNISINNKYAFKYIIIKDFCNYIDK